MAKTTDRNEKGQFIENNKTAEKWTESKVIEILQTMYDRLIQGSEMQNGNIVRANDIKLAGEIRLMFGVSRQMWNEWQDKFKESVPVSDFIKNITEILECRVLYSGQTMDIFLLKNKYGYKDKQEITGADGAPLNQTIIIKGEKFAKSDINR